jgi:hypothetical protein
MSKPSPSADGGDGRDWRVDDGPDKSLCGFLDVGPVLRFGHRGAFCHAAEVGTGTERAVASEHDHTHVGSGDLSEGIAQLCHLLASAFRLSASPA